MSRDRTEHYTHQSDITISKYLKYVFNTCVLRHRQLLRTTRRAPFRAAQALQHCGALWFDVHGMRHERVYLLPRTPAPTRYNQPEKDEQAKATLEPSLCTYLARMTRIPKCTGGSTLPSLDNRVVLSLMSSDETPRRYPSDCLTFGRENNPVVVQQECRGRCMGYVVNGHVNEKKKNETKGRGGR